MYTEILQAVSQVGFPIAVAAYSLTVLNKTIKENTKVMIEISTTIRHCEKVVQNASRN